jgi:hypothetical protein
VTAQVLLSPVVLVAPPAAVLDLADITRDVLRELLDVDPWLTVDVWCTYPGTAAGLPAALSLHVAGPAEHVATAAVALADGRPVEVTTTTSRDGAVDTTTWSTTYAGVKVALSVVSAERRERPR